MKFLLVGINAKFIHTNPALFCLKAYADKYSECNDATIEIAEYTINWQTEDIVRDIVSQNADFVGFSSYIWNIDAVKKVSSALSKISPRTYIWLGGPEVSFNSDLLLSEMPYLTGIMVGEGEETFTELVKYYLGRLNEDSDNELSKIKGIAFINDGDTMKTPDRGCIEFNKIPFIYDDLSYFKDKIIYYESSRGCPFSCAYCLSSIDKQLRFKDIGKVKEELRVFIDANVPMVKFVDRTFNCNQKRTLELLQFLRDSDNGVTTFHFEIAGDILSKEECAILETLRPGLVQLEIGVQSTNEISLDSIKRKTDLKRLFENASKLINFGNMHIHLDLIAGLPYENYDSFVNSFNEVFSLKPHELQLGFLKVLFGTYMHEIKEEHEIVYNSYAPYEVLSTKYLSYGEICILKNVEEMLEIYYNSGQYKNSVGFLLEKEESPFNLFLNLSEFYAEKGLLTLQSSRILKYEILLEYVKKKYPKDELLFRDELTLDFYLREKAKSRPSFSNEYNYESADRFYCRENVEKYFPDCDIYDMKALKRQTHYEQFAYLNRTVIFDYFKRDPIYHDAKTEDIQK